MIEILQCVLGEALVFCSFHQRDGCDVLIPVATVDQRVEFRQRLFEVVEMAHVFRSLLLSINDNVQRHGLLKCVAEGYLC